MYFIFIKALSYSFPFFVSVILNADIKQNKFIMFSSLISLIFSFNIIFKFFSLMLIFIYNRGHFINLKDLFLLNFHFTFF